MLAVDMPFLKTVQTSAKMTSMTIKIDTRGLICDSLCIQVQGFRFKTISLDFMYTFLKHKSKISCTYTGCRQKICAFTK